MTYLLFLDESQPNSSKYTQISGCLMSVQQYKKLRLKIITKYINDELNINPLFRDTITMPYYKWNNFLPNKSDKYKFKHLKWLIKNIYTSSTVIFCYGIEGPMWITEDADKYQLIRWAWFQVTRLINKEYNKDIIIPIIDLGLEKSFKELYDIYSKPNYQPLAIKALDGETYLSIKNPENMLEPLFSQDHYSIGVQMADILGGFKVFNSNIHKELSNFNDGRKNILGNWLCSEKTICVFEYWSQVGNEYHAHIHDSYIFGQRVEY